MDAHHRKVTDQVEKLTDQVSGGPRAHTCGPVAESEPKVPDGDLSVTGPGSVALGRMLALPPPPLLGRAPSPALVLSLQGRVGNRAVQSWLAPGAPVAQRLDADVALIDETKGTITIEGARDGGDSLAAGLGGATGPCCADGHCQACREQAGAQIQRREPRVQRDSPQDDAVLDRERQAVDRLRGRSGQPAGSFLSGSPVSPRYQPPEKPPSATLTIGALLLRPTSDDQKRQSFDTQAEATAYAAVAGAGSSSVVMQDDKLWFAATLVGTTDPTFERTHVYRFDPAAPVVAAIGSDGFVFTSGEYTPEEDHAALRDRPENDLAHPPDAASLRALVGMNPKADGAPPRAGMTVPAGQEEAFVRSYLVSRALESLNENRAMAEKLAEEFKPTEQGGIGPAAKALVDKSRALGADYQKLEENETKVGEAALAIQEKHNEGKWNRITAQGRTQSYFAWVDELNAKFKQIQAGKDSALALSPLLASMVYHEQTPSSVSDWAAKLGWEHSTVRKVAQALTWPLSAIVDAIADSGHGAPSWKDSELNKSSSAESDTKVAQEFRTKLDGVQQAISRTIARVAGGDVDYLLELSGLRSRVQADVDRLGPENQAVKDKYKEMLATHEMKEEALSVAGTIVQIGALFLPGGQFISAAHRHGHGYEPMDQHLNQLDASKAAVDPATALADQQQAVQALLTDTLNIALQAIDLAVGVKAGLDDLEAGRVPKGPEDTPGVPKDPNAPVPPGGKEPITVQFGSRKYTWVEGKGVTICVNPCGQMRDFLDAYGEQLYVKEARGHSQLAGDFVEKQVGSAKKHLADIDAMLAANPPKDRAALTRATSHADSVLEEVDAQKRFSLLRFPPDAGGPVLSNGEWADALLKELKLRKQTIEQTDADFFGTLGPDVQARAQAAHAGDLKAKIGDLDTPDGRSLAKQIGDEGTKASAPDLNKRAKLMDDVDKALTNYGRELRGQRELVLEGGDLQGFSDEEVGKKLGITSGPRPDYVAEIGNKIIIGDSKGAGDYRKAIDQITPALDSKYVKDAKAAGKTVECRVYLSAAEAERQGLTASPTGQLLEHIDGADVPVVVPGGYPLIVVFN